MQSVQPVYTTSAYPGTTQGATVHRTSYDQRTVVSTAPAYTTGVPTSTYTTGTTYTTGASGYRTSYPTTTRNVSWVSGFSRYSHTDLRGLFDRYDRDRSGSITFDELRSMYNEQGTPISDSALAYLQNTYDRNRDGKLSYSEFHEFITGTPYTGVTYTTAAPAYTTTGYTTAAPVYTTTTATPTYTTTGYTHAAPVHTSASYTTSSPVYTTSAPVYTTQTAPVYSTQSYTTTSYGQWNPTYVSSFSRYGESDLRSLFDRYDRDRSGSITFDELRNMYNEQGTPISDSALAYLQNTYDRNRDGRLSYPEFYEYMTGRQYAGY